MSTQRFSSSSLLGAAAAVALLLALAGHAEAEPRGRVAPTLPRKLIYDVNINKLIDANMDAIRGTLFELDPTQLKDVNYPLTPHIFMELSNGWMQNLSQLKRAGKCSVRYINRVITMDMNFGWDEIAVDYRYLVQMLLITRKGDVHSQLSDLKVHVVVELNLEAYEVRLRRMEFTDTDKITIKLEGHLTDFLYNLMIETITFLFKDLVLQTIESKALEMIQSNIDQLNYLISKDPTRMIQLVNLVIPFDYENDVNPRPIDHFLLEKH